MINWQNIINIPDFKIEEYTLFDSFVFDETVYKLCFKGAKNIDKELQYYHLPHFLCSNDFILFCVWWNKLIRDPNLQILAGLLTSF
jgi:hypothetical protein